MEITRSRTRLLCPCRDTRQTWFLQNRCPEADRNLAYRSASNVAIFPRSTRFVVAAPRTLRRPTCSHTLSRRRFPGRDWDQVRSVREDLRLYRTLFLHRAEHLTAEEQKNLGSVRRGVGSELRVARATGSLKNDSPSAEQSWATGEFMLTRSSRIRSGRPMPRRHRSLRCADDGRIWVWTTSIE